MGNAMQRILEEDPGLRFYRDAQTKDFLLAGSGGQHVEIVVSRMKKRYNVDVELRAPKIPYRETIRATPTCTAGTRSRLRARAVRRHQGEGGSARARAGFEFVNDISAARCRAILFPRWRRASSRRPRAGIWPVTRWWTTRYAVRRPVSRRRFIGNVVQNGRPQGFQAGMEAARATLLEPIMKVEVVRAGGICGRPDGRHEQPPRTHHGHGRQGRHADVRAHGAMSEMLTYRMT